MIAKVMRILRVIWTLTGLSALCGAIWFGLPLLGQEALAGVSLRLGLIAAALLWYGGAALIRRRFRRKAAAALEENLTAVQGDDSQVLAERMGEAVARLKARRGVSSLYDLPWYVLIGPPGAGKTTALVHSGLAFPGSKPASVSGIGGTRNCDFWFADEAVLIDTAGRYTTQDSDAESDGRSWAAFLKELKRARADQPINGVMLAVSCDDIMRGDGVSLAAHAAAVRARLEELTAVLRVNVPVYAVFTKADLISGFREYFGKLAREDRKAVWGVTFQGQPPGEGTQAQVGAEFDRLVARLTDQMPARMADEKDTATRNALFRFPEQMLVMKDNLDTFLRLVFQGDQGAVLRGFYFTSGTQEGTPFDQILGALVGGDQAGAGGFLSGRGRSFFLHDLLREVVFAERGWVGFDRRRARIRRWMRGSGLALIGALTLAGMALLAQSFWANASLVRAANGQVAEYERVALPLLADGIIGEATTAALLRPLALLRDAPGGYGNPRPQTWAEGLGLSRGAAVTGAVRAAYSEALERLLRPRMMVQLEHDLAAAVAGSESRAAFEALRTYLLVAKAPDAAGDDLAIQRYFARAWAAEYATDPTGYGAINRHLAAMLELDGRVQPQVGASEQVVAQVRRALAGLSDAEIVYASLAGQGGTLARLRPLAGIGAEGGLRVSDGRALATLEVEGLLTPDGYEAVMAAGIADAPTLLAAQTWVLARAPGQTDGLSAEVAALYLGEVQAQWEELLNRIEPSPEAAEALGPAVRAVVETISEAMKFPDNLLFNNDNMEIPAWAALAENSAVLQRLEQAMNRVSAARDFAEVQAALGLITPDLPRYPQALVALTQRVGESLRAGMVRAEVIEVARQCQALADGRYPFAAPGHPPMPLRDFTRLIGPEGLLAELERAQAARRGIGGGLPRVMRETLDQATALRQAFLSAPDAPYLPLTIRLAAASQSISALELRAGPDSYTLQKGGAPITLTWPWDDGAGGLSLAPQPALSDVGETLTLDGGIWAMIPLLTATDNSRQAGGVMEVSHTIGTRTVTLRLTFERPDIPFLLPALTALRCPRVKE